jgi:hypothetical protein
VLRGDDASAAAHYAECLSLSQSQAKVELVFALEGFAEVFARRASRNQLLRGARLFGAAAALRERLGAFASRTWLIPAAYQSDAYAHEVAVTRAALGDEAFDTAWAEGRRRPVEAAIADALNGD